MPTTLKMLIAHGVVALGLLTSAIAGNNADPVEVVHGVFVSYGLHEQMTPANRGAIGNSGFIVGEESVAVIDPGGSLAQGERLKRHIEEFTELPVKYVILTHFHPDHVAGAMAFADTPNVMAHENYSRAMTQRAQFFIDRFPDILPGSTEQMFLLPTRTVSVDQPVTLDLGARQIMLEAYPLAHTDNDLSVLDIQSNTLWASDLLFAQRTPSVDGSVKGWLQVLAEMDKKGYGFVIPGHGKSGEWGELYDPQHRYLATLRDFVRDMIAQGMSLSDVLAKHDEQGPGESDWLLYAAQHGTNLAKAYTELEWE